MQADSTDGAPLLSAEILFLPTVILAVLLLLEIAIFALTHLNVRYFIVDANYQNYLTENGHTVGEAGKKKEKPSKIRVKYPLFLVN